MYRRGRSKRLKPPKEDENILRLPSQITLEILSRLPVKTVIHCRSVCKAWRSLLLDPCFPQTHLAKSPQSLMLCTFPSHYWLIESETDFRKSKMSKFNGESAFNVDESSVVGSCNGLLCLTVFPRQQKPFEYCVWNPILNNDYIALPMPNLINKEQYQLASQSGFGFCPWTNTYKVIRMLVYAGVPGTSAYCKKLVSCEVYTLGTNAWRAIEDVPTPYPRHETCTISFNGAIHWLCCFKMDDDDDEDSVWVCAFRIGDEKWGRILMPLSLLEDPRFEYTKLSSQLGVVGNCLAMFECPEFCLPNIWLMKEYGVRESWTKCWSVGNQEPIVELCVPSLRPLKLTTNGELLLFDSFNQALVRFNPEMRLITHKQKIRGIPKRRYERHMSHCIAYVASFISPTQVVRSQHK